MRMRYKSKLIIEALQLRWDTWSEMCKFIDIGKLSDAQPEGCFGDKGQINLKIPTLISLNFSSKIADVHILADEDDYIIKDDKGLRVLKPDIFENEYELIEEDIINMGTGWYGSVDMKNRSIGKR